MIWTDVGIEIPPDRTGEVLTTCPKCSASRKKKAARCLSVNVDTGVWYCHHCGWRGNLQRGEQGPSEPPRREKPYRPMDVPTELSPQVVKWFGGRGISEQVLRRNGVVSGKAWMPQEEDFRECIWFPYRRKGELVNVKFRDGKKNFRMIAGAERVLYGLDDAKTDSLVWVEGEIDKLSMEVAGITSCVSVPDGAPAQNTTNYAGKFSFLDTCPEILEIGRHILAVDADSPGVRLREELARRLGHERCWLVDWPQGIKDANEALVKLGPDSLAEIVAWAKPYPIEGLHAVEDQADKVRALYEHGWRPGIETTWLNVNRLYRPRTGEFTVVTGIPGHGKSSWVDAFVCEVARKHGWRFAVFSPENWPIESHVAKYAEIYTGFPFGAGPTQRMDRATLEDALSWVGDHAWWIGLAEDAMTLDAILDKARAAVRRHGVNGVVIDPWNEVDHSRDAKQSETEHISESLSKVRRFARTQNVHVWLVAHPAKLQKGNDGKYPVPTPYDISGSANWRNKADNCLSIWRNLDDESTPVLIHVQKIRFRECGKLGVAELSFDRRNGRYADTFEAYRDRYTEED